MQSFLRIVSIALITAGFVVLLDVAATLAWKEPLSTIYGSIHERLVLTACHPLYSAARRWAVFAKLTATDLAGD